MVSSFQHCSFYQQTLKIFFEQKFQVGKYTKWLDRIGIVGTAIKLFFTIIINKDAAMFFYRVCFTWKRFPKSIRTKKTRSMLTYLCSLHLCLLINNQTTRFINLVKTLRISGTLITLQGMVYKTAQSALRQLFLSRPFVT